VDKTELAISEIWVCWVKPEAWPAGDTPILSFLSPAVEEKLERTHGGPVILAREASRGVRSQARALYINLVGKIGTASCENGFTLRQALTRRGEGSRWWYHAAAFKECESDPAFNWIITVLTIRDVAEKLGSSKLVLVGAPGEVAAVLKSGFTVEERQTRPPQRVWWIWLRSVGSRAVQVVTMLRQWNAVRQHIQIPKGSFHVVFSGFWDWSVSWDDQAQSLADRYFKNLPDELKRQGVAPIGWFCWFAPHAEPGKEDRRLKDVLEPAKGREGIIILQAFLRLRDILRAAGDFQPLATFVRVRQRTTFREIFLAGGLDYYPLFSGQLLRGFLDASIPLCELVALATERACRRYRPKVALSFLEHFPYSRAHYEGVGRGGNASTCYAIQHASYNHEKTFLFLDPALEFRGEPDGCAVPHPNYVFAMGTLGRELFLECGYPKENVLLTGSPRYDHIRLSSVSLPLSTTGGVRAQVMHILILSTLHQDLPATP